MNKTKLLLILIFTGVFLFSATAEAGPFDKLNINQNEFRAVRAR